MYEVCMCVYEVSMCVHVCTNDVCIVYVCIQKIDYIPFSSYIDAQPGEMTENPESGHTPSTLDLP